MDRRQSLKLIATGAIAAGTVAVGCKTDDKKNKSGKTAEDFPLDRYPEEVANENRLLNMEDVFTADEMATITILADIIIPKDEISGSASDAGVPEFIAFIVKDMPDHQLPMKGGLRWLDMQCLKRYEKPFKDCSKEQQLEMVDLIAFPDRAKDKPELAQGVAFFNRMRDLTASGFYTSKIGVADIGYVGNTPNQWNGVPDEVLKQYNLSYSEKDLKECLSFPQQPQA